MTYQVVLTHTEEGYSVNCPVLPGCWSEGDTEAEALENIQDAIAAYISGTKASKIKKENYAMSKVSDLEVRARS